MAEYKRIISYLYKYEKGIKGLNVGYVKLDIRQNNLKILIHIQDERAINDKDFQVYFYYRDGSLLKGILGGITQFCRGESTFRSDTLEQSIFHSNYSLEQTGGMIIHYNEDFAYGTEWDDKPIVMRKFIANTIINDTTLSKNTSLDTILMKPSSKEEQSLLPSPTPQEEHNLSQSPLTETTTLSTFQEMIDTNETPVTTNKDALEKENSLSYKNIISADISNIEIKQKPEPTFLADELSFPIQQEIVDPIVHPSDWKELHNLPIDREIFLGLQNIYNPSEIEKKEDPFDLLMAECPPIQHSKTHIPLQLVRIQPQDIGKLPINYWHFGSNSFLVHGYYQFQYLVFGKKLHPNENAQYLIGVPSLYTEQENEMAFQFGFKHFIPMKPTHIQNGTFGYWIAFL